MQISIKKLLFENVRDSHKDVTQNIYVFRFICYCIFFYTLETILNELGIFIVDKTIFRYGYFAAFACMLIYFGLLLFFKFKHPLTKYISITALVLIITAANISLTYHMLLIITLPIIVAGMYSSKKLIRYTFILVILSIIASTYGGYFFGLCDANMVLLTVTSLKHLTNNGIFTMNQVNPNPIPILALFYVIPRCLMAISFAFISKAVNNVIKKSYSQATRDSMTGLYNKNKLIEIIENGVYDNQNIGVIYWDVNRLKFVNDTYGHQAGDSLITKVAHSIYDVVGEKGISLRYGGDEFIAILSQTTQGDIETLINRWNKLIEQIQLDSEYPISAAVGYAMGEGKNLREIIKSADKNMYTIKKNRR